MAVQEGGARQPWCFSPPDSWRPLAMYGRPWACRSASGPRRNGASHQVNALKTGAVFTSRRSPFRLLPRYH
jgi:hypothetical protein